MASRAHEVLVQLFRNCGELAPELLRLCGKLALPYASATHGSIDFSQVVSTEYRADAVIELRDGAGELVAAVIVEVQRSIDPDKRHSWPLYVAALRATLRRPVFLLVLAPEPGVARWARASITLGHPGFELAPMVIELDEIPRAVEPGFARRLPELAVLAAMAHPELEAALAAVSAIAGVASDRKQLYFDMILAALPGAVQDALEARMQGYEYQSNFARRYFDKGRHEGREEGRHEGELGGLRKAALALARARFEALTADDLVAIDRAEDEVGLTELVGALGRARDIAEARAALGRLAR